MFLCKLGDPGAETIALGWGLVSYRGIRLCAIQGRWTLGGRLAQELLKKGSLGSKPPGSVLFSQPSLGITSFFVLFWWCCLAYLGFN